MGTTHQNIIASPAIENNLGTIASIGAWVCAILSIILLLISIAVCQREIKPFAITDGGYVHELTPVPSKFMESAINRGGK